MRLCRVFLSGCAAYSYPALPRIPFALAMPANGDSSRFMQRNNCDDAGFHAR
jgi:hypothetical protein